MSTTPRLVGCPGSAHHPSRPVEGLAADVQGMGLAGRSGLAPLVQAISYLSWAGLTRVSWTGQWASMNSTNAAISSGVLSASMW